MVRVAVRLTDKAISLTRHAVDRYTSRNLMPGPERGEDSSHPVACLSAVRGRRVASTGDKCEPEELLVLALSANRARFSRCWRAAIARCRRRRPLSDPRSRQSSNGCAVIADVAQIATRIPPLLTLSCKRLRLAASAPRPT